MGSRFVISYFRVERGSQMSGPARISPRTIGSYEVHMCEVYIYEYIHT